MKKYFWWVIMLLLSVLFLSATLVIIVDPFIHYHAPIGKLAAAETDERSAMVGIAKNMHYDTALIGSSMSENFIESWFEDGVFGNDCVKLCMQGAHFDDFSILFREVLEHETTQNVVFSMDTYLLTNTPADYPTTIPEHLYNDILIDDVYYFWNKDVIMEYLPKFILNNHWNHYNADSAYVWADSYHFSKETALGIYNTQRLVQTYDEKSYDTYLPNCDLFLHSVTPFIENNPEVTFYFYSSPYSILFWDDSTRRGESAAEITALTYVFEHLLKYENVRIFYFQDDTDIITNLDNYRDYSHFSQDINYYMYESMRDGTHELNQDNYYDTLINMYEFVKSYDYESIFH